ncbi:uncharacterized protein [Diadema antillarum]|uniref:uncharacterized protein n=1 Tax=Diadema antillarum TaxID=105358 RepID=UPI003A8539F2
MENVPGDADATEVHSELGSLPEVVESVSQAQKQQASEIAQHRKVLVDLQVRHEAIDRRVTAERTTGVPEKDMPVPGGQPEEDSTLYPTERRLIAKYRKKMENFSESVRNMEALSTDHTELNENQRVIDDLERERDTLKAELVLDQERGELLAKVQMEEETHRLQIAKADLQQQVNHLQGEIMRETSKQTSIRQDIEVLQKRNRAQLTRLKCQLKEAQVRNWQWSREASQLEAQLDQLTAASQTLHDE